MNQKPLFFVFLMVITLSNSQAFGVSTPYWDNNPLLLYPGQEITITLKLQNMVGTENYTFIAQMVDDLQGIASLVYEDQTYIVPLGTSDVAVPLYLKTPENSKVDETLKYIHLRFIPITETTGGGMVMLTGAVNARFPIQIIEKPLGPTTTPTTADTKEQQPWNYLIIIILALLLVIILIYYYRKNKRH